MSDSDTFVLISVAFASLPAATFFQNGNKILCIIFLKSEVPEWASFATCSGISFSASAVLDDDLEDFRAFVP